jgi:hypothetical protein
MKNIEYHRAAEIAERVLDQSYRDPDDATSVLARQLLRTREKLEALWHFSCCPFDHCERCIRDAPIIKGLHELMPPESFDPSEVRESATT